MCFCFLFRCFLLANYKVIKKVGIAWVFLRKNAKKSPASDKRLVGGGVDRGCPPMIWASMDEAAGLEELGEEGVEEGGGEGVGEDEAVFPAVGPPAGGLDPEGLPEGAVFFVGKGGVEDFAEDAVDEGGVALEGRGGFGARASFDGRAAPDHGEDRGIEAQIAHADGIQRVGEADHILPLQDAVEPGPVDL